MASIKLPSSERVERWIQQESARGYCWYGGHLNPSSSCQRNGNTLLRQECFLSTPGSHQRHYKCCNRVPLSETQRERERDRQQLVRNEAKANLPMRGLQGQYAQNLSTTMAKSIPLKTYHNTTNSTVGLHTQKLPVPAVLRSSNPLTQRSPKTQNPNHQQQQALPRLLLLLLQDCTHHHKYPPPASVLGRFCHNRVSLHEMLQQRQQIVQKQRQPLIP